MRPLVAVLFGALAVSSFAQELKYTVSIEGRVVGEAKTTYQIRPDRGVGMMVEMHIGQVALKSQDITGPDGMPISKVVSQKTPNGLRVSVTKYSKNSATITITEGGKTTTKTLPYPKTGTMKSTSELWFLTVKPKLGAKDNSWEFNETKMAWEETVVTYTRDETIKHKGKSVKAHVTESSNAKVWLNDKGLPYRVDLFQPNLVIRLDLK